MNENVMQAFRNRFDPNLSKPGDFSSDSDVILFLHIPKTAGMSVGKALQAAFENYHSVDWRNIPQSFRGRTHEALYARSAGPCRQVIMGHFGWPEVQYWRVQELPVQCATIIRDPVARLVSNYHYNRSEKHPPHREFQQRFPTLESYAHALPLDLQLTTMIGMFYDFDHALELLTTYYSFIGVTEKLGASLEHFRKSHALTAELPEHRENTGSEGEGGDVPQVVRDIVLSKSRNDQRLHDLVMSFYD